MRSFRRRVVLENYLLLNKTIEAKQYIAKALELEPTNNWMLLHLVAIQKKERNYQEAIKTQLKLDVEHARVAVRTYKQQ